MCIIDCLSTIVFILPLHLDYTKVFILILWWRNFQLEYWRTFQLVSTPLGYDTEQASPFYAYKIKHLLTSAALGMMPATAWSGKFDANGGYLVVKKDGEILCYHFYDRNRFEDYLFSNAYLERSSTSRHEYASIIKENDGTLSFKLNFQVRLK